MSSGYEAQPETGELPSKEQLVRRVYAKASGTKIEDQDIEVSNILEQLSDRPLIMADHDPTDPAVSIDADPDDPPDIMKML